MNYQQARQRKTDGRWHFTNHRDEVTNPIGYCADESSPCHLEGHDTPEGAAECYKRYLLDKRLDLTMETKDAMNRCRVCGEWTQKVAAIQGSVAWMFHLCDRHRNRVEVCKLMGAITWITTS